MALCQQEPEVPGVLSQPAACLPHYSLLDAPRRGLSLIRYHTYLTAGEPKAYPGGWLALTVVSAIGVRAALDQTVVLGNWIGARLGAQVRQS